MNDTADRSTRSSAGSLAASAARTSSTVRPVTSTSPDSSTTVHSPLTHGWCCTDTDSSVTAVIMAVREGRRDSDHDRGNGRRRTAAGRAYMHEPAALGSSAGPCASRLSIARSTRCSSAAERGEHPRLRLVPGRDQLLLHARARLGQPGDPGAPVAAVVIAGDQAGGLEPVEQRGHRGLVEPERLGQGELRLARARGDGGQHDPVPRAAQAVLPGRLVERAAHALGAPVQQPGQVVLRARRGAARPGGQVVRGEAGPRVMRVRRRVRRRRPGRP